MTVLGISFTTSAILVSWLAILLLAFAMAGMLRQIRMLEVAGGPSGSASTQLVGAEIVEFRGSGEWTALLFLDRGCAICDLLRARLPSLVRDIGPVIDVVLLFSGDTNPRPEELESFQVRTAADELFARLGISATPYGILLDPDARVRLASAIGSVDAFEEFMRSGLVQEVNAK